eukprot:gene14458-19404_t
MKYLKAKDINNINKLQLFLVVIILLFNSFAGKTISVTSDGEWLPAKNGECDRFMCTSNSLTWHPFPPNTNSDGSNKSNQPSISKQQYNPFPFNLYNNETGCDALLKKGITRILFFGDSFMRQIYAGMLITLNGDFRYGSQADPSKSPECEYQRQFWEKRCGTLQLNHVGKVCGGKILLDPLLHAFHGLHLCSAQNGTVAIWSFANYKLFNHGRYDENCGVNNATMYQKFFNQDICPQMKQHQNDYTGEVSQKCSVWWVSTHYRVKGYFADEQPDKIRRYNEDMRHWFESDHKNCGNVNYIDVYNMTARLTINHTTEAEKLTYDKVHWGMEVNMIKAQIIINALVASPDTINTLT